MKKTLAILDKYINLYTEQDATAPVPAPAAAGAAAPEQAATPEPAETNVQPQVEPLSPESEVLLVRLLKKALVMDLDENDINTIDTIGDINETTAKTALQKLMQVMQNYSEDVNIKM